MMERISAAVVAAALFFRTLRGAGRQVKANAENTETLAAQICGRTADWRTYSGAIPGRVTVAGMQSARDPRNRIGGRRREALAMKTGKGIPVFPGVAIAPAVLWRRGRPGLPAVWGDPAQEQARFDTARRTAREQLSSIYEQTRISIGEEQAGIVQVQLMLLEDPDFLQGVRSSIDGGASAAQAALDAGEESARMLEVMDDVYMRERGADVRDMARRLSDVICGEGDAALPEGDFLLVAEDLSPSETLQLPRARVRGILLRRGSTVSHTAILARMLGIPCLVKADVSTEDAEKSRLLAVDGFAGVWYADPDAETLDRLRAKAAEADEGRAAREACRGRAILSPRGKRVRLMANIGSPQEAEEALQGDAEGVGLMRSEFLYLGRNAPPDEEELYRAYRQVAQTMGSRPVIIRTLDIGADKQAGYLGLEAEENPALGLRGLRLCLAREELFRTQLRAIYRASAHGRLLMMFPMVTSLRELRAAKEICARVRQELAAEGCVVQDIPIGVMVETPAAALIADELAREAAFLSVGTNDLIQYTLAADRQNAALTDLADPCHPALMTLYARVARAAEENGIWAGVCGELAAEPEMQQVFINMGYTEMSMAAGRILETRARLCNDAVQSGNSRNT